MDKQEVLKEYRKTEDRILLSQVLDKIEIAEKRNQIQYTDFLDMYQVALVKKFLNKNQLQNYILYGGFEDAERKIAIFYSDNYDKEIVEKDYQKMLKVIKLLAFIYYYLFLAFLFFCLLAKIHQIGLAINIEEQAPDAIPTINGKAKSLTVGTNI